MPAAATLIPTPAPQSHRGDVDARGCRVSGANARAMDPFEAALAAFQAWRGGADAPLALALQAAPGFVMAHVLKVYLLLCSRDVRRIRQAREVCDQAARQMARPTQRRERLHLAAIGAVLADDYSSAKALLGTLLRLEPRDVLALQVAHALDYLTGDVAQLRDRVARVLPAWSDALPGHHAVLAMHAFGLVECGETDAAERAARAALALNPLDARAHHAMAHVFETRGTPEDGVRWMAQHARAWGSSAAVATHCAWHAALFHLAAGRADRALAIYDRHVQAAGRPELADLIDASALLWRVQLRGGQDGPAGPVGAARWEALADAWEPHIDDGYCSFSDVHAMLAFIGARRWALADRLERKLAEAQALATRHGATTRAIGLPAARALRAFGQGRHTLAITLLASLPVSVHRLGGSHAQRDVLHLTLQHAVERIRRPALRRRASTCAAAAQAGPATASRAAPLDARPSIGPAHSREVLARP
jgi:tetratricopeptide (TPR) repeat protein